MENPNNYGVLSKLITFMRNSGDVNKAEKYIKKSKSLVMNVNDTGLAYCEGLFHKYKMQPNLALQKFNKSRRNPYYIYESIYHMIDIYLNPE